MLVDSGNFSDNPTPQGEIKTRALLEGMSRIGYQVVNVGERDIRLGHSRFLERTANVDLRFVSANIVDLETGEPVFAPHVVVEAPSHDGTRSLRIGVTGLARFNPVFRAPGTGTGELAIAHPLEPLRRSIEALATEKVDFVVLLAALNPDDARRLIEQAPGIDFVVGSYGGFFNTQEERVGGSWLLYAGNQGKRLGATRVFRGDDGTIKDQLTKLHLLTDAYPSVAPMKEFVDAALAESEEDAGRVAPGSAPVAVVRPSPRNLLFVGGAMCKSCHADHYEQWKSTAHASAFHTLEEERRADDETCRTCHSTGTGFPGGFTSRDATPALAAVGCESCHGRASLHVQEPRRPYGKTSPQTCTRCHDRENSPAFDYYEYARRVAHDERSSR